MRRDASPMEREKKMYVQTTVRFTREENECLWALHRKTLRSLNSIVREALVRHLSMSGVMDLTRARTILEQWEKKNKAGEEKAL